MNQIISKERKIEINKALRGYSGTVIEEIRCSLRDIALFSPDFFNVSCKQYADALNKWKGKINLCH